MLAVNGVQPDFDMGVMGAAGCRLFVAATLEAFLISGPGDASRAEGKIVIPSKLPNNAQLIGTFFHVQLMTIDSNSKKALGVVTTNRLTFTIGR